MSLRHVGRFALAAATVVAAHAATAATRPPVLDVVVGTHVTQLSAEVFVDPTCVGADGEVVRLWGLERFAECVSGDDGQRTIAFRHDDTAETEALARRNEGVAARESINLVGTTPAEFAFRIDPEGRVVGYVVAAPAAPEAFAAFMDAVAGPWSCTGPSDPGPASRCTVDLDRTRYTLDWPEAGEAPITLTVAAMDAARMPATALGTDAPRPDARPGPPYSGRLAAFLAGASTACPGCDLADADLRWRDLSGADLSNADLEGAILHGSSLVGANLSGARLGGANLNRTDLSGAVLRGADLASAYLFAAVAPGADFTGAGLSSALIGNADLTGAIFDGASLDGVDFGGAILDGASLFFATLRYATIEEASFAGADLRGAIVSDASAARAVFAGANLSDASLARSDLRLASFASADLSNADLADTLLEGADFLGAVLTGADVTGAVPMPALP